MGPKIEPQPFKPYLVPSPAEVLRSSRESKSIRVSADLPRVRYFGPGKVIPKFVFWIFLLGLFGVPGHFSRHQIWSPKD